MEINVALGEKIKKLREQKGLSQERFAEIIGIHRTYVGCIERGEKNITLVTAKKISNALDISLSELLIDI